MTLALTRFWFEFESINNDTPYYLALGCGVTAYSYEDAVHLLDKLVFEGRPISKIKKHIENIDISTLDADHILPNMVRPPNLRGIWYPQGF
ncbi:hypothetical protein MgSA37_04133 [Mucilaginibacter gotjawali]|uniref:Uncharacterized protein n=2 Tax=Mucilaginibacter gotjawali TaxID=1550579 RepID=A0A0X8X5E8_9SPHI|nr:hypothetical protein [Mucilaginibacter gotjawali]BAU55941.1 hypothetical protein MgSA37_04133 [Mucilaginibacter gotjawali]